MTVPIYTASAGHQSFNTLHSFEKGIAYAVLEFPNFLPSLWTTKITAVYYHTQAVHINFNVNSPWCSWCSPEPWHKRGQTENYWFRVQGFHSRTEFGNWRWSFIRGASVLPWCSWWVGKLDLWRTRLLHTFEGQVSSCKNVNEWDILVRGWCICNLRAIYFEEVS